MLHWTSFILALAAAACTNASAGVNAFDSSDPVVCLTIFGIAVNGHKQAGNIDAADRLVARSAVLVRKQGGVEWLKKIAPEALKVGTTLEAANDRNATIRLLEACEARQAADPGFRRSRGH